MGILDEMVFSTADMPTTKIKQPPFARGEEVLTPRWDILRSCIDEHKWLPRSIGYTWFGFIQQCLVWHEDAPNQMDVTIRREFDTWTHALIYIPGVAASKALEAHLPGPLESMTILPVELLYPFKRYEQQGRAEDDLVHEMHEQFKQYYEREMGVSLADQ